MDVQRKHCNSYSLTHLNNRVIIVDKKSLDHRLIKKRVELFFKDYKHQLIENNIVQNSLDLYISPHFVERIAERRLYNDVGYIANLLNYFINQVFNATTQCNKNFTLKIHNLRVGVSIVDNHYVTQHRAVIVKTAFDRDEDEKGWFSNEVIEVKAVKKNERIVYEEI